MKSLIAVAVAVLIWTVGLFVFADRVVNSTPAEEPPQADGIVALTGASDARIQAALDLLRADKGRRVLISGVDRTVRREELKALMATSERLFDCCVDLGYEADTTLDNAQEIKAWTQAKGFDSLIVVTSDYHMPRALLEIRGVLPGVQLEAYAVRTPSLAAVDWWKSPRGARVMALEYCKYLVVLAREAVLSLGGPEATPEPAAGEASGAEAAAK